MRKLLIISLILMLQVGLKAQDPQFSQFYNTSLMINPAYVGGTECYRAGINARTQWLGLQTAYNTTLAYMDFNYADYNSGLGFMALYDQSGIAKLNNIELSGLYSYQVQHKEYNLRMGIQGSFVSRHVDYSKILFEDQFSPNLDVVKPITDDPIRDYTTKNYADFSAGFMFYKSNKYWVGFSAHHLNRPEQGFFLSESRLPIKYSVQLGYKFEHRIKTMTSEDVILVYPCFLYKSQAKFDQADYGIYSYYNHYMFGLFYRGIYFKQFEDERNKDAFTVHLGYNYKHWQFFYSYDFTINHIGLRNTWGSHEIAVVKKFCLDFPPQKKMHYTNRALPCPDFRDEKYTSAKKSQRQHKDLQKKYKTN
jgi:type IX secretion system PorP/SprF family membrane protein